MAYTKKTWVKGSTPLSAENFNHMEQGIADAHTEITQLNSDLITRAAFAILFSFNSESGRTFLNWWQAFFVKRCKKGTSYHF